VLLLPLTLFAADPRQNATAESTRVFFGTYTGGNSKGIYVAHLDLATGQLSTAELAAEVVNPSFLALHPNRPFLYAVNEVGSFAGQKVGAVTAFAMDPKTGKLDLLNQQPSGGGGPCHLTVDGTGNHVLVANYGGGSCSVFPVQSDGRLGEASAFVQHQGSSVNPQRQKAPHAHGIYVDRQNRFALVPDLGLDQVLVYRFDPVRGTLAPNDPPFATAAPGAGPRHLALDEQNKRAYVINEMHCTITAFNYDAERGKLDEFQTLSTLPEGQQALPSYSTAEIALHPSGKFLYGSNRGHDSLAVFRIDPATGRLTLVQHEPAQGKIPRSFGIDPSGRFLLAANQDSDSVVSFRIDAGSGRLSPTGQTVSVGRPVCVIFAPNDG
jgi:6-phosphogluconolactonase